MKKAQIEKNTQDSFAVFMNGDRKIIMKIVHKFEDGSVRLIDGDRIAKENIIEIVNS